MTSRQTWFPAQERWYAKRRRLQEEETAKKEAEHILLSSGPFWSVGRFVMHFCLCAIEDEFVKIIENKEA